MFSVGIVIWAINTFSPEAGAGAASGDGPVTPTIHYDEFPDLSGFARVLSRVVGEVCIIIAVVIAGVCGGRQQNDSLADG